MKCVLMDNASIIHQTADVIPFPVPSVSGRLVTLRPEKNRSASKTLNAHGEKIADFSLGAWFTARELSYDNADQYHSLIGRLLTTRTLFLVLGELTPYGRQQVEAGHRIRRRKRPRQNDARPTLADRAGRELVLDIDGASVPGFDPFDPEPGIQWLLKRIGIDDTTVTWQLTSSQKLKISPAARVRLYLLADRLLTLEERRRWARALPAELCIDACVFSGNQPVYTAPPTIEGDSNASDPLPLRSGVIWGESDTFTPVIPPRAAAACSTPAGTTFAPLPLDALPVEAIGDRYPGRGLHAGVRDAIWLLVLDDASTDQQIIDAVRQRATKPGVLTAQRDPAYVLQVLSDNELLRSIEGARDVARGGGKLLTQVDPQYPTKEITLLQSHTVTQTAANDIQEGGRIAFISPPGFGKTRIFIRLIRGVA